MASGADSVSAAPLRLALRAEAGVALFVDDAQRARFGPGGGGFVRGAVGPTGWLDVQLAVGGLGFSGSGAGAAAGGIFAAGGGVRLQLPRDRFRYAPFVDADVLYVRTGALNRLGFSTAAGVLVGIDPPRKWRVGAFVRYLQVFQPAESGIDDTDAKAFLIGATAEYDLSPRRSTAAPVVAPPPPPPPPAPPVVLDTDGDGLVPPEDRCPDKPGSAENHGCPSYKTIKITSERIELNQKVFFAYDRAEILPKSYVVLDEVVQAMRDYPMLRLRFEGHTDNTGAEKRNLELSTERALAVQLYLVERGISQYRLSARGYGSAQPLDSNGTPEGRERNRRVEFVVVEGPAPNDGAQP